MKNIDALFDAAMRAHRGGQRDQARQQYQRVLKAAPKHAGAHFLLGKLLLEQGEPDKAVRHLQRAAKIDPSQGAILVQLGVAYISSADLSKARRCFEQAAKLSAANPAPYHGLGEVYRALGEPEQAITNYRKALQRKPDLVDTQAGLGEAFLDAGRFEEAIEVWTGRVEGGSDAPRDFVNLAAAWMGSGNLSKAEGLYREAARKFPGEAPPYLGLGAVLERQERFAEAVEAYETAIRLAPDRIDAYLDLAEALETSRRLEEAASVVEEALRIAPGSVDCQAQLAWLFGRLERHEDAEKAAREVLRQRPDCAPALVTMGKVKARRGDFDGSEKTLRKSLRSDPRNVPALMSLAEIRRLKPEDGSPADFEAMLEEVKSDTTTTCFLHNLAGDLLERDGRFDEAFAHFKASAAEYARAHPFDLETYLSRSKAIRDVFNAERIGTLMQSGSSSQRPIFITGMARSGTSLIEQIVASHPRVFGGGEMNILDDLAEALPERPDVDAPFPECVGELEPDIVVAMAEDYLAEIQSRNADADRVTDKSLSTYSYLGLAAILFPRARFIHCQRDPLDTCLSCFLQQFEGRGLAFTYDLAQLGAVYRGYLRLMEHWRKVLPVEILDVQYEDLVADQEAQSRRIIGYCGLEWDEACLDFYKSKRTVETASLWQVRQPIYSSSIGRWKVYEQHLEPLRRALGDIVR